MKILLGTAIAVALLSACGQRSAEPSAATPAGVAAADAAAQAEAARQDADAGRQAAATEAAIQKRLADYRARLIPLMTGAYSGQCNQGTTVVKDAITVSADGVVSARQWKHDLKSSNGKLVLSRTLEAGKPVAASAAVDNRDPEWSVTIMTGREEMALISEGTDVMQCASVTGATSLRGHNLYAPVASFFMAGASTLACAAPGDLTRKNMAVKAAADGLTVGERTFSFARGIVAEIVAVNGDVAAISYGADYDDGTKLVISLDRDGKLSDFIVSGKDNLICMVER